MPGLILEGGTFRPLFSCGVMDALLDEHLMFDYVSGVSAGITYAFSYLSQQRGRNLEVVTKYRNDRRYLSVGNYLKCKSVFGLDFVFDEIPNTLFPFDWYTFHHYSGRVRVGVTNAETGKAEYLDGMKLDTRSTMLRATCALPYYFPPIDVNGTLYYDGGIADSIPIAQALRDGSRRNLIVLTRPEGYWKTTSPSAKLGAKAMKNRFPALAKTMLSRAQHYNETTALIRLLQQRAPADTVVLRPEHALHSFEKDVSMLKNTYEHGYQMAMRNMDAIKALFAE